MHRDAAAQRAVNVAFCSAAVGYGHTRASVAVHDALRARGQLGSAAFIEALEHAPTWFTRGYRDGYLRAIRHAPRLVGAIYDRTDVPRRDRRLLGPVLDRVEDAVLRRFREHGLLQGVDAVVSRQDTLCAGRFTLADISVAAQIHCIQGSGEGARVVDSFPTLADWKRRVDAATLPA